MKFRSLNLSLLGSLEAQHEARQILEMRFRQRHRQHDGTGRDGLAPASAIGNRLVW
jgi:hypothetical protein